MLNWDNITEIEFNYWTDDEYADPPDKEGGYWNLSFIGNGDQQYLGDCGERYMSTSNLESNSINNPNTPISQVSEFFLIDMLEGDTPFFITDRKGFQSYLNDWISEYYAESFSVNNEAEFIKHIEKFLPYMGIQDIADLEVGASPVKYLKILKNYGATFNSPENLYSALRTGDLNVCKYILEQGNSLDNLFKSRWKNSEATYFHEEANCYTSTDIIESTKTFYSTTKALGVSIDLTDKEKCTPLHYAAKFGSQDLYEHLVSLGANEHIKNVNGNTPLTIMEAAKKKFSEEIENPFSILFDDIFYKE